jgi:hypothetical protein
MMPFFCCPSRSGFPVVATPVVLVAGLQRPLEGVGADAEPCGDAVVPVAAAAARKRGFLAA